MQINPVAVFRSQRTGAKMNTAAIGCCPNSDTGAFEIRTVSKSEQRGDHLINT